MIQYKISTPNGFMDFHGTRKTKKNSVSITTNLGKIIASLDHKFIINDIEVCAKSLKPRQKLNTKCVIVSIKFIGEQEVYDVLNVDGGNVYLHDFDIVSHNCFLGSSMQLLTPSTLSRLSYDIPIKEYTDQYSGLKIYATPKEKHSYVMTVDVSRGRHLDASAFWVVDVTAQPYRIAATYNNNEISPLMYATLLHRIAVNYNDAYVLIEINDVGAQVAESLYYDFEYDSMFWTKSGDQVGKKGADPYPGIRTTKKTKRIGCANLKDLIEKNNLIINDELTIKQLSTFIQSKSGSYEADEGFNDDMVACGFLFAWLCAQPWFKDLTDQDMRMQMYSTILEEIEQDLLPTFGFSNGLESYDKNVNYDVEGLELLR
jgi:hypothetical protein